MYVNASSSCSTQLRKIYLRYPTIAYVCRYMYTSSTHSCVQMPPVPAAHSLEWSLRGALLSFEKSISSPTFWVLLTRFFKKKSWIRPDWEENDAVSGRNGCMQPIQGSESRRGLYRTLLEMLQAIVKNKGLGVDYLLSQKRDVEILLEVLEIILKKRGVLTIYRVENMMWKLL